MKEPFASTKKDRQFVLERFILLKYEINRFSGTLIRKPIQYEQVYVCVPVTSDGTPMNVITAGTTWERTSP